MATVLVVDDRAEDRDLACIVLRPRGWDVLEAASAEEALEIVGKEPCDLVISDLLMPGMDGYEFVYQLRADAEIHMPAVLFMSAVFDERDTEELAVAHEGCHFLAKPYEPQDLLRAADAALARGPAQTTPPPALTEFERDRLHLVSLKLMQAVEETEVKRRELETRVQQQEAIARLGRSALAIRDVPSLLDDAAQIVAGALKAELCEILELQPGGEALVLRGGSGWRKGTVGEATVPIDGPEGHALTHDEPVTVSELRLDSRFTPPRHLHEHRVVSGISTAIQGFGALGVWTQARRDFSASDLSFLRAAASTLAQAVERAEAEEARAALEAQLLQSQKMEAIGRLAGGIAHDFKNLLTIITGFGELVLRRLDEDHPSRRQVEEICAAGMRAVALTEQLLAFSRRQSVEPRTLDLNAVVTEIEPMLRRLIGEDVELVTGLEPKLGLVRIDPSRLEQVLMNLVVNARDAMPEGGTLTIESANSDLDESYARAHGVALEPGRYVVLAVTDTGLGMDEETKARIFEPFFTTKEAGKGTGLGLATIYGIVKQAGGFVWVYSEPGEGTTFKIYLPCVEGPIEPLEERRREPEEPAGGSETLLVVEDEEALRTFVCEVLAAKGYRVIDAPDGAEAARLGETFEEPIDLLLTDVVMPGMRGTALARLLLSKRPELRVLYMSAYTERTVPSDDDRGAIVNYVEKPFGPDAIALKVREALDAPSASRASGDPDAKSS